MSSSPLFRQPHRIAFHEVDAGGRLFGGHVFQFFIDAYFAFLVSRGVDPNQMLKTVLAPLVHVEADFARSMPFAADLMVEIEEIVLGTTSMTVSYRIVDDQDPSQPFCTGKTIHVFVDPVTLKKCVPPEPLASVLSNRAGH